MPAACRLLVDPPAAGAWNMAADEVLLDSAVAGRAALRLYGWAEPTLTLGYFQPHRACRARPPLGSLPWLRRPTGGEAIVHHHELTYALALPPGPDWQPPGEGWMTRMHRLIAAALAGLGVEAVLCPQEARRGDVLCFLHPTPGDLLLAGHKIAGSAQRRQRGGLLQHGSVLLRQSPFTPELPGVGELTGRAVAPEELGETLAAALAGATGWALEREGWSASEREGIAARAAARYAAAAWNEKR